MRIFQGTVFDTLPRIDPGSVDCVVTSPPYWALRSYLPREHPLKPLELGSEKTPAEFVENLVRVFRLVRDAMADHGVCFLNVGDTYWTAKGSCHNPGGGPMSKIATHKNVAAHPLHRGNKSDLDISAGNLCLIPQRLAIALQDDGWLVRSIVIWRKPAPMPQSVSGWMFVRCRVKVGNGKPTKTEFKHQRPSEQSESVYEHHKVPIWSDCPGCDKCRATDGYVLRRGSWRPTSSYEPILMLAKSAKYFADGIPVQTEQEVTDADSDYGTLFEDFDDGVEESQAMANARDVQTWAAEPLRAKHYAAYPSALVQWCLKAGTSAHGYCETCRKPWVRVVELSYSPSIKSRGKPGIGSSLESGAGQKEGGWNDYPALDKSSNTIGWRPSCQCERNTPQPGLVLDPFCGSGRTAIAALRQGLDFVGCELNPEYVQMAEELIREESPLFAGVELS